jgi:hypothetical protein
MSRRLAASLVLALFGPALARGVNDPDEPPPSVMAPFLVEESMLSEETWLYAKGPGFEILSACDEQATARFSRTLVRLRQDVGQFLPRKILTLSGLPATYILIPKGFHSSIEPGILDDSGKARSPAAFQPVRDILLADPDSVYFLVELNEWEDLTRQVNFINTTSYIQFLLGLQRPRLAPWFVVGMTGLYGSMRFPWPASGFAPEPWLSEDDARSLRRDPLTPRPLLPLDELFLPGFPADRTPAYRKVWRAEAELFVRWALSGDSATERGRLWALAEATANQPPSEALFQSTFGLNYADGRDALSDFLPRAVGDRLDAHAGETVEPNAIANDDATGAQCRRILSELARRCMSVARAQYPDQATLYTSHAEVLLRHAYSAGPGDADVAASWALFLLEIGDRAGARKILAHLAETPGVRPLARLEWGRLKLQDALRTPEGKAGSLSEAQGQGILGLCRSVQDAGLSEPGSYDLESEVLGHLRREPTGAELGSLYRGSMLFPDDAPLLLKTVSWLLRQGEIAAAQDRIHMGLWENSDPSLKAKFEILDHLVRGGQATGGPSPVGSAAVAGPTQKP